MNLLILTPSYNSRVTLRQALHSVRNQMVGGGDMGFEVRHHVQDGGSVDGTLRELESFQAGFGTGKESRYTFSFRSEPDGGMYDALNRGFFSNSGELAGHMNADEQYLPGTLAWVHRYFAEHPDCEILCGGAVVVTPTGDYICSRLPVPLSAWHTAVCHLPLFTAATFFRRRLIERLGVYFDTEYKTAGDADFFLRVLESGTRIHQTPRYLALFTDSGDNLALSPLAAEDSLRLRRMHAPALARRLRPFLALQHRIRKWRHKVYSPPPFSYEYLSETLAYRRVDVRAPTGVWRRRL